MPTADPGPGMTPVQRAELVTDDMDQIAELLDSMYVEHRARIRRVRDTEPQASTHGAQVGPLKAARYTSPASITTLLTPTLAAI